MLLIGTILLQEKKQCQCHIRVYLYRQKLCTLIQLQYKIMDMN